MSQPQQERAVEEDAKELVLELLDIIEKALQDPEIADKIPKWAKLAISIAVKVIKLLLKNM